MCAQFRTEETRLSKSGAYYTAANGTNIYNKGQQTIQAINDNDTPVDITFQVCDVKGPLGSVREMVKAGNKVVFGQKESYIEDQRSGRKTHLT